VECVLAESGGVSGVGEPLAVIRNVSGPDGEECESFGELVAVKKDFFGGVLIGFGGCAAFAAVDCVLQALFGARVVPPGAVTEGN